MFPGTPDRNQEWNVLHMEIDGKNKIKDYKTNIIHRLYS